MKAKEKAIELVRLFGHKIGRKLPNGGYKFNIDKAKELALIAVDETLWVLNELDHDLPNDDAIVFYIEVKQEIEKL